MGIRGNRKKGSNASSYQEPELHRSVDEILKSIQGKGFYKGNGNTLDIEEVVKNFADIELQYEEMEANQSGSLSKIDGKWIIKVNKHHHKNRQRFTIAHELGHYVLHKEKNIDFLDSTFFRNDEMDSIEYIANEFAARLLMPEDSIRELIENQSVKNIGSLSEQFGVSSTAMKYRVLSLGYKMKDNG